MTARVLFAAGGTGGHINPALATAHALREHADVEVEFVGTPGGMEARMVPADGWLLHHLPAAPLRGKSPLAVARAAGLTTVAAARARRLLRERGAVAACVFGGYVSGPLALGARLAGVPLVLHEQNAVPGLANRMAARWARTVAVSVPDIAERFAHPDRVRFTGNPVRADIAGLDRAAVRARGLAHFDLDADRRTVLVFGGSLGARRINDAVLASGVGWTQPGQVQVLLVAGARDHERVAGVLAGTGLDVPAAGRLLIREVEFVDRMDLAYAAADVAVCRAGASTIAELAVLGLPSVLVPYPHAAADEQTANARALAEAGAAVHVGDSELDAARLVAEVEPLLAGERAAEASRAAARFGRPDAAADVADAVLSAAGLEGVR